MKKVILILIIFLLLPGRCVFAEEYPGITEDILSKLDMYDLEGYMNKSEFYELYGYSDPKSFILDLISGNSEKLKDISLWDAVVDGVMYEFRQSLSAVTAVMILGIMSVFVKNIAAEYLSKDISKAVDLIMCLNVAYIVSGVYFTSMKDLTSATTNTVSILGIICPAMLILISMTGAVSTANILSPTLMLALGYGELFINSVIVPLCVVMFILNIADCVTDSVNLKDIVSTIKKTSTLLLGTAFTILSGVISIEGIAFSGADKIGFKAIKYAAGNLIPVVGGFLSGTADTALSLITTIKGGIGLLGIMILLSVLLGPVVKMFCVYAAMKVSSLVVGMFSDDKTTDLISRCASGMGFLLSVNVAVGMMSFVMILMLMNITLG